MPAGPAADRAASAGGGAALAAPLNASDGAPGAGAFELAALHATPPRTTTASPNAASLARILFRICMAKHPSDPSGPKSQRRLGRAEGSTAVCSRWQNEVFG